MAPVEMMALPQDAVVVLTQAAGQVRFIGQAIPRNPSVEAKLPPLPPRRKFEVRTYTAWAPSQPGTKKLIPGPAPGEKNPALPAAAGQSDSERPDGPAAADERPSSQKPQQGRLILGE